MYKTFTQVYAQILIHLGFCLEKKFGARYSLAWPWRALKRGGEKGRRRKKNTTKIKLVHKFEPTVTMPKAEIAEQVKRLISILCKSVITVLHFLNYPCYFNTTLSLMSQFYI